MTPDPQPTLPAFVDKRPRELVVSGNDLAATLASIRAQGGIVQRMDVDRAEYRLSIGWPSQVPENKRVLAGYFPRTGGRTRHG